MPRSRRRAELFTLLGLTTLSQWTQAQEAPAPPPDATSPAPAPPAAQGSPPTPAPASPYPPGSYPPGSYPPGSYPPGYPPAGQYAPGQYPPPAYGAAPYPPGYVPPPGYQVPGYAYPYYAPQPDVPPKPRYPDDAAARTSPFVDLTLGGTTWSERFSSFFNVGVEAGLFVAGAVRIGGRVQIFPTEADDNASFNEPAPGFFPEDSEPPSLLYGASVGYALASSANFVLSPGILFMRTDTNAYGNFFGLTVPFEWVNDSSIRIGFEIAFGRTFGGDVRARCSGFNPVTGAPSACTVEGQTFDLNEVRDFNRPAGMGLYSHFQVGLGFNRPGPLPTR